MKLVKTEAFIWVLSVLLASCSGLRVPLTSVLPEEALRQRAESYWAAKKNKDWKAVRGFVDPEVVGKLDSYFAKREQSQNYSTIVTATVKEVQVQGHDGRTVTAVRAQLTHPLLGGKRYEGEQKVEERWVQRNGTWYVVINPLNLEELLQKFRKDSGGSDSGG